jgi:hypothetical protein
MLVKAELAVSQHWEGTERNHAGLRQRARNSLPAPAIEILIRKHNAAIRTADTPHLLERWRKSISKSLLSLLGPVRCRDLSPREIEGSAARAADCGRPLGFGHIPVSEESPYLGDREAVDAIVRSFISG